jgi:ATP-binding cassette subfamily B protein
MIFVMLPRASVSANRIMEVLETKTSIYNQENPKKVENSKKGYVEFENVSFSYPGADEKVLEDINFVAKPGETTAFIGTTGSGKSTLINLIPRLFDVTEGTVKVNCVNVKDVNLNDLHDQIGYIPQKGSLLSGTIESNLKYGNENADEEFVKKCAEVAQATEFIENKEEKYNSLISQGAKNVSGCQKQRLSIARALVKNAPIYIFDDSFSALDFKTDRNLRAALKEHTSNATILIVAQRVSTIMNAEQIIVLENGKIVGKGTHKELLKNCPTYFEIASSQLSQAELNL